MSVNPTALPTSFQQGGIFNFELKTSAIWLGIQDRLVCVIQPIHFMRRSSTALAVIFTVSAIFGIAIAWAAEQSFALSNKGLFKDMDYSSRCYEDYMRFRGYYKEPYYRECVAKNTSDQLSPKEKKIKAYQRQQKDLSILTQSALLFSAIMPGIAWCAKKVIPWDGIIVINFIGAGLELGFRIKRYYDRNSNQKVNEFVEWIKKKKDHVSRYNELNLSRFCEHLKYFNLFKLWKKIHENFKDCTTLVLRNCRLTDSDLNLLAEAGCFEDFSSIELSENSQITGEGLKQIGKAGASKLTFLELNATGLTDNDLKEMAESGYFRNLERLTICNNPQITGRGLAYLGGIGFEKLKWLDIGSNPQVLGSNLDLWIHEEGFKKLEVLRLSETNLLQDELKRMIHEKEWVRKLKGLDLSANIDINYLPENISLLKNLANYESGPTHPAFSFAGVGLFIELCPYWESTLKFTELIKNRKAFVSIPMRPYSPVSAGV